MSPDIERIAREAGIEPYADHLHSYDANTAQMSVVLKFAQLIAAECAKACDVIAIGDPADPNNDVGEHYRADVASDCADAIRERFGLIPAAP